MRQNEVRFSIAAHAAWAPGVDTPQAWMAWSDAPFPISGNTEPGVRQMPPMLRRRAGFLGKMALEVAYTCLDGRVGVPTVFCSRHGETARSVELLADLADNVALSPTSFGLAVHNASAGLFSIARADQANHVAIAAGNTTIEHAVIEACSLLADGEPEVLLVAYDNCLPHIFAQFDDCHEQPYAWAWLLKAAGDKAIRLSWQATEEMESVASMPAGLEILRFHLRAAPLLERITARRLWRWMHDA